MQRQRPLFLKAASKTLLYMEVGFLYETPVTNSFEQNLTVRVTERTAITYFYEQHLPFKACFFQINNTLFILTFSSNLQFKHWKKYLLPRPS